MHTVLLVADRQSVVDRVQTSLAAPDINVIVHPDPTTAADAADPSSVDSVLVDMQIGSMGAMAVTRDIRAKSSDNVGVPVTILLDRDADAFLAGRAGAAGAISKDASPSEMRSALALDAEADE